MNPSSQAPSPYEDDSIDFGELFSRLKRGLPLIAGLVSLGLAITAGVLLCIRGVSDRLHHHASGIQLSGL